MFSSLFDAKSQWDCVSCSLAWFDEETIIIGTIRWLPVFRNDSPFQRVLEMFLMLCLQFSEISTIWTFSNVWKDFSMSFDEFDHFIRAGASMHHPWNSTFETRSKRSLQLDRFSEARSRMRCLEALSCMTKDRTARKNGLICVPGSQNRDWACLHHPCSIALYPIQLEESQFKQGRF